MKLPEEYIQKLNSLGFGGRLVYVPLAKKTASDAVYADMLQKARQRKHIDIDEYRNTVSMRTLYRLKKKAILQAQAKGDNNEK